MKARHGILFAIFLSVFLLSRAQQKMTEHIPGYHLETVEGNPILVNEATRRKDTLNASYYLYRFWHGFVFGKAGDMKILYDLDANLLLDRAHFIRFFPDDSMLTANLCSRGWILMDFCRDTLAEEFWGSGCHSNGYSPSAKGELFPALGCKDGMQKWGYMNRRGEWVIGKRFEAADAFQDGIAFVRLKENWAVINRQGDFLVKPIHSRAQAEKMARKLWLTE